MSRPNSKLNMETIEDHDSDEPRNSMPRVSTADEREQRGEENKVPEPIQTCSKISQMYKHSAQMTGRDMPPQMQIEQYEENTKLLKEKLFALICKGKRDVQTFESKDVRKDAPQKKFLENLLQGQKEEMEMEKKEFLKDSKDTQVNQRIDRPSLPLINPQHDVFEFFCIDIDHYVDKIPRHLECIGMDHGRDVSIIRMYGVTEAGNSVTVHVFNFKPYIFIQIPTTMKIEESECEEIQKYMNTKLSTPGVEKIEIVQRRSIMHYTDKMARFLKVTCTLPKHVNAIRTMVEKGMSWANDQFWNITYESSVPHGLRFMIDNKLVGMSWVRLPASTFRLRPKNSKRCTSQLEIDILDYRNLQSMKCSEGKYQKIAPLRILSFDIECLPDQGKFPTPEKDPIIQIGNICQILGQEEPYVRNIFTLESCAPIVGTQVFTFKKEDDMLMAWREFVKLVDPDILTGYNIINFDIPYIISRGEALNISGFPFFGRVRDIPTKVRDTITHSKAMGIRESKDINIEGRIQFDLLQFFLREHKLRSYSLNTVSSKFLGEQKEEVQANQIADLFNGNEFTRRRLAIYCLKDSFLPMRLMTKLEAVYAMTEIARVCGIPMQYLFTRGQQIKISSLLYRKAQDNGLLIPTERERGSTSHEGGKYEGGAVLEAVRGYYQEPCAVLDFSSLYPSIMMAHNLCYSTIIPTYRVKEFKNDQIHKTPNGDHFINSDVQKGVLPQILEDLVGMRKDVKDRIKTCEDETLLKILENRQQALKLSANSVYGFTGASVGQLPCLAIAASVTAYGRKTLELTQNLIQQKYTLKNGYAIDSQVFYGDTDSVMVRFGCKNIEEALQLGREASAYVSEHFEAPIKLEFEKVYCPFLLMSKKRYAGLLWTSKDKYDKIDCKGIETVRRDNCALVQEVVNNCLKKILIERSYEEAIEYIKKIVSDLLQNRVDLSLLVITKGLGKKENNAQTKKGDKNTYQVKNAHTELAKKLRQRDANNAPTVGDRVSMVMVRSTKNANCYEKSEDPLWALEHDLPIDYQYYLDHHLKQPLIRLFEPILQNPEKTLFVGEHTRSIYVPKLANTGLGKFAVVKQTCLACKRVMTDKAHAVCDHCKPKLKQIYIERQIELDRFEKNYSDLWVQCQRCQGSLHQDVLCQSRDCPIFYQRVKSLKNLKEARETIKRFDFDF